MNNLSPSNESLLVCDLESRQLQTNELFYRDILDNISDAVYLLEATEDGRFRNLEVNRALEEMTGLSREQLIGKYQDETMSPETAATVNAKLCHCLATGTTIEEEVELDLTAGKRIFHSKLIPVRDDAGHVHRILGITQDITENKLYTEELQRWHGIFEHAEWGVVIGGVDGTLELINPAFAHMHGYTVEELTGRPITDVYVPEKRESLLHEIKLIHEKGHHSFESVHMRKDGTTFPVFVDAAAVFDSSGNVLHRVVNIQDITERKEMHDRLLNSEARYRSLYTKTPAMLHSIDKNGVLVSVSDYWLSVMGYQYEEVIGRKSTDFLTEKSRQYAVDEVLPEFMESGVCKDIHYQFVKKDGSVIDVLLSAIAERDEEGDVIRSLAVSIDITERKRLEDNLRQSEQQFRSLAESSPDSIIRYDLEHRILYLNGNLLRKLGLDSQDEVIGKRPIEVWPDGRYAKIDEAAVKAIKTGIESSVELSDIDESGRTHYFLITVVPERDAAGEIIGTLAFGHDVTSVRDTERELRTLMENIPDFIARFDSQGRHLYVNPAIERAFGMPAESFIGKTEGELEVQNSAQQSSELAEGVQCAFAEGEVNRAEAKWVLPEGERYFDVLHVPEKDENGNVISVLGIAHDITEFKEMQEELHRREQMFRALAENSPNPIFRYDRECHRLYVNPVVGKILGKPVDELVGSTPDDGAVLVSEENRKLMEAIHKVFDTGEVIHIDSDFVGRDGRHRVYDMVLVPECDVEGEVNTVLGLAHDITAIRKAEQRLTRFMANVPGFVYTFRQSPEGDLSFPFVSPGIHKMYGLKPEDLRHDIMPLHVFTHPDDQPRVLNAIAESAKSMTPFQLEFRMQRPGLTQRWIETRSVPERDADGGILWHGVMLDITERKMAEESLRESEEKYRTLIQKIQAAVIVHGADTQIIITNTNAQEILGLTEGQLLGKKAIDPDWHFSREDGSPMPVDEYPVNIVMASQKPLRNYVARVNRSNNGSVWVLVNADPVFDRKGKINQVIVTFIDISERKHAEEALRESEQRFRGIFDNVLDTLYLLEVTEDGRFRNVEVNPAFEKSSGIPSAELIGKFVEETVPEETARIVIEKYRRCVETGRPIEEEVALELPAGTRHYHSTLIPVRGDSGRINRIVGISRDITERKAMEAALLDREQQFRTLAENAPDLIMRYDLECRRIYVNPAFERELGIPENQALNVTPAGQWPPNTTMPVEEYMDNLRQVVDTGEQKLLVIGWPRLERKGMTLQYYDVRIVAEYDSSGIVTGALVMGHNITSLKLAQQHLEESQWQLRRLTDRLEVIREEERKRLARELHDEFGQLLTAIRMETSMLGMKYELADKRFKENVQRIVSLVDKTIKGVRNMAAMLRPEVLEMGVVTALEWLVDEFNATTGISCILQIDETKIDLDEKSAIAIFRIVQESLTNVARHAKADRVNIRLTKEEDGIRLKITDNGQGFDPYLKKEKSLGLVGIRERAIMLGGEATITSAKGEGTVIEIYVPVLAQF